MNIYIPFTYIIGWSQHKKFYYGAKYAQGCQPKDLWESYFTSSKYVEEFRKENGDPDIIKIHRTFSDPTSCILFEHEYLTKVDARNNLLFLNKSNGSKDFGIFDEELQRKKKETCIKKYGYEFVLQVPEIRERVKLTSLEKYGNEMYLNSFLGKHNSKKSKLEKYGDENYNNREKATITCIGKYGVDHPNKSEEIKIKTTKTLIQNYGVTNVSQIENSKEKKKLKSLEVYGTENVLQAKEIKDQIRKTNLEKYGVENVGNIQVTCPWCNKIGSISGMTANHFDNCPKNPQAVILYCNCGFQTTSKGGFSTHIKWCKIRN